MSSLDVAKGSILIGNIEIFWGFLGDLPFPQFHPTNNLNFSIPPFHVIFQIIRGQETQFGLAHNPCYNHVGCRRRSKARNMYTSIRLSTPVVPWLYSILDPRFAGLNPAEIDGFFQRVKILSMTSFGREIKPWVPCQSFTHVKDPQAEIRASEKNLSDFSRSLQKAMLMA